MVRFSTIKYALLAAIALPGAMMLASCGDDDDNGGSGTGTGTGTETGGGGGINLPTVSKVNVNYSVSADTSQLKRFCEGNVYVRYIDSTHAIRQEVFSGSFAYKYQSSLKGDSALMGIEVIAVAKDSAYIAAFTDTALYVAVNVQNSLSFTYSNGNVVSQYLPNGVSLFPNSAVNMTDSASNARFVKRYNDYVARYGGVVFHGMAASYKASSSDSSMGSSSTSSTVYWVKNKFTVPVAQ